MAYANAVLTVFLVACALSTASAGRTLHAAYYPSIADALTAAQNANLSTLLAAIGAANLTVPADATWTIFAPTDAAFASSDIKAKTGLAAADLLKPENKKVLVSVLSYHVVPAAAMTSTQLKDGQQLTTALADASPLIVSLSGGAVKIKTSATDKGATVTVPDIKAGKSVVHVIDQVLLPPSLVKHSP